MKGLWWPSTQPGAQEVEDYREQVQSSLNQTQIGVLARRQLVTALLAASIVLAVYALYQWSISLLLVVTGMALCALAFHLLVSSNRSLPLMSDQARAITQDATPASPAESSNEQVSSNARTENRENAKRVENAKSAGRSGETAQTGEIEPALALDFPQTPMPSLPSSPLIRVLETIDLSSSDIEHFIKTSEMEQKTSESAAEQVTKEGVHEDMP